MKDYRQISGIVNQLVKKSNKKIEVCINSQVLKKIF